MAFENDFKVKNGLVVTTTATVQSTTVSTSTSTGALIVAGGAGLAGDLALGGGLYASGTRGVSGQTLQTTGAVVTWTTTTGMTIPLALAGGLPTDGSWAGAINLSPSTTVSDAIDGLNGLLSLLVPSAPPDLSTGVISITSVGTSPLKASGSATDNTGGGTIPTSPNTAGNTVVVTNSSGRLASASGSTNVLTLKGSGSQGTMAVSINGSTVGNVLTTFTSSTATTAQTVGATVMTARASYPVATPGFWISFSVQAVVSTFLQGWNRVQITHTVSGNTNEYFVLRDNVTTAPALTGTITLVESGTPTYTYSSGVPHYGSATASLIAGGIVMSNIAGETYYNGNPISFAGTNSITTAQAKSYATVGVTTPVARQTISTTLTDQTINIDGTNVHTSGTLQATATNVNGSSAATSVTSNAILVMRGTATGKLNEQSITVTGLGSSPNANAAVRIGGLANSDQPTMSTGTTWVSSSTIQTYDAVVAAGILTHNQINYSTAFLPAGPNYSTGRSGTQYATFVFQRDSRSNFNIVITGTYAGCWVALPGVSSTYSSTGWWNMFAAYSGAGVPGDIGGGNGSNGCASGTVMAGASGTYLCTFGTQSSTNSTGNYIIVRLKLTAGQSVTALSFTN